MKRLGGILVVALPLLALLATPALAEEHAFVGTKNCKKCHLKEWKSWSETKMGQAFETLKPGVDAQAKTELGLDPEKDYTKDAECVGCHVTGYGKPGGFVDIETTPDLAGVGCESCHGAGGTYTQEKYMSLKNKEYKKADLVAVGMVETVGEAQCVSCHKAHAPVPGADYVFDYAANKDKGTHEHVPLKYSH